MPEGYDFVDYFLFHGQEGYCTYFATAMAIMLRLEEYLQDMWKDIWLMKPGKKGFI